MRIFTLPPTVGSSPEPNFYDSLQKVRLRQQLEMYSLGEYQCTSDGISVHPTWFYSHWLSQETECQDTSNLINSRVNMGLRMVTIRMMHSCLNLETWSLASNIHDRDNHSTCIFYAPHSIQGSLSVSCKMCHVLSFSQEIWPATGPDGQCAAVHGMRGGGQSSFPFWWCP